MRDRIKVRVVTLLLGLSLAASACATLSPPMSFEDATAAYRRGDYATALRLLRPLAEQGNANAQSSLGFMYTAGQGVPQDYAEAVGWYRKAADQGGAIAQYNVGEMYANGRGVPRDGAEAVRWYREAAEQGDALAQSKLGSMYADGRGAPQDYVQAHMGFSLAVARFLASETEDRENARRNRSGVTASRRAVQIVEAERFAPEWKPK